jgi:hypothetical protein
MTVKLVIASALLLLTTACVISPYGGGAGYGAAYYGDPRYGGYAGNDGYAGREGLYRGGGEVYDGDREGLR